MFLGIILFLCVTLRCAGFVFNFVQYPNISQMDPYNDGKICQFKSCLLKECGQVRRVDSTGSIFISGIFRNHFQEGELGKVKFQAEKLENIPDLLPICIMFVSKQGILGIGCQGQI